MSVSERRARKDRHAATPAQLLAWRCGICMVKISQAEYAARNTDKGNVTVLPQLGGGALAFRLAHLVCPSEPLWSYRPTPAGFRRPG